MGGGFTTRPELQGTFGVVSSTRWIASAVGMAMLEKGGNAFDAAVAAGFTLQIVEPHLCGPAGEVVIIFHHAPSGAQRVLCGQGPAPAAATPDRFADMGLGRIPGAGLVAAAVPGAFDAWLTLLGDYGVLPLDEVLAPAIGYAEQGHPLLAGASRALADAAPGFRAHWPSSADVWLQAGEPPAAGALFRNPALASVLRRIVDEAAAAGGPRERRIERARAAWRGGFVAEAIDRFCRGCGPLMDASGEPHPALLTGQDMARFAAAYEAPLRADYRSWTICKTGPWGQGPVLLQALKLLEGFDVARLRPDDPELAHVMLECLALAMADRDAYYGDPAFVAAPMDELLGAAHADQRRALIGEAAATTLRPGVIAGFEAQVARTLATARAPAADAAPGIGEPSMAHLRPTPARGDTTHLDVIDREGNMVSATPSGGWPQSSPTIPGLGFALGTRLQMCALEPGLAASLAPGKRPRTTLTPTLALQDGRPALICGSPGGDQQDQWQFALLSRRIDHGLGLQESIDLPLFHTLSLISSFDPHEARPGSAVIEAAFAEATLEGLRARGHRLSLAPPWSVGRLTAAERRADGVLCAAASPRLMQAYAVGR